MTHRPVIDISPALTPDIAVWPGDTPLSREVLCTIEGGASVTLSTLRATVHLGAHADGVNHYGGGAAGIEAFPLERYLGPCHVVRARAERRAGEHFDERAPALWAGVRGRCAREVMSARGAVGLRKFRRVLVVHVAAPLRMRRKAAMAAAVVTKVPKMPTRRLTARSFAAPRAFASLYGTVEKLTRS